MEVLKKISFEDILPVWKNFLWVGRKSSIQPMSSMTFERTFDKTIYERFKPTFFGLNIDGKLIGVNSFHRTGVIQGRSRGIYLLKEYRGNGYSKYLLTAAIDQAKKEGCNLIWSLPRVSSLPAYLSVGYEVCSKEINEGVEFGPNIYVKQHL